MNFKLDWLKRLISESPAIKACLAIFSLILVAVLSGAFVAEITIDGKLRFGHFYRAISFYLLLGAAFLIYLYYKVLHVNPRDIENFKDDEFCKAYIRKECLPAAANKINKMIEGGKSIEEIKNILKDMDLK